MDPLTHGVAALALQRAFWPRASWRSIAAVVSAGILADVDWITASLGPAQFLRWHRTATHSLTFAFFLALAAFLFSLVVNRTAAEAWRGFSWLAVLAAGLLHLLLDLLQADSVALLWPFSSRRLAFDLLPSFDLWLLTILAAAILLPELFRLVGEEIGLRSKTPRGRNGAIGGLFVATLYIGLRLLLHANAVAALEARTIAGEAPRRVAAFPDSTSLFLWHGVVETQSALHRAEINSAIGDVTYTSGVTTIFKPEPSPMLDAAQHSPAAIVFLKFARFPKATLQRETEGYSVEIQDLKDQATGEKRNGIIADINLDNNSSVVSSELQWSKKSSGL